MSIIRKVFTILLGVTLMFMNISGVKAQDDNTTTDFSNYITAASLDYKEGDKEIAYKTDTKLTEDTPLVFKLDADVPSSALSGDHKIDYQLPDNLNVDDTTSDHIYLKDDLTKSVGNYTVADHHMVIDLSALDYGVDSSKSIELDLETTTSHLIFTDSEAKIYFRKATNESPTEVMVSVLQSYTNDTKADPNSIIKNTNTDTNTKKSSKQVITMSGVKRADNSGKARAGVTQDGFTEIYGNINDLAKDGRLSGKYRLTDKPDGTTADTTLDKNMSGANAGVLINNDVTIDLNGHKLQLYDGLYFDIQSGGHLTILDSASKNYNPHPQPKENTSNDGEKTSNAGNLSVLTKDTQNDPDKREVPVKLDYYVTHAEANGVTTTDTTTKYEVDLSHAGRIYSETGSTGGQDSTFMIEKGGTLDFESGVAYNKDIKDNNNNENTGDNHVVATKDDSGSGTATLNLSGGYLIGNRGDNAARNTKGNVIYNNAGNTLNISGGVITNGQAENGGGIYNAGGTINLSGGIITGNESVNDGNNSTSNRYSGGGIYMKSGTLNISGNAYITNNRKSEGTSVQDHFSVHGGGGVAADNDTQMNMSGGYITGNYSKEAGGGLYLGYYENLAGTTQLMLTGGIIAGNVTQTGEGGGIRIGGKAIGYIRADSTSKVYITNNITNTGDTNNGTGDWGGGGIFVQENGILTVMNSLITNNIADGFGGGVSACPTGSTTIVGDDGSAIYGNDANGNRYSRGSGKRKDDNTIIYKNEDRAAYEWKQQNNNIAQFKDYFLAHESTDSSYYRFGNEMLGGGSQKWQGTFEYGEDGKDGKAKEQGFNYTYHVNNDSVEISANFIMLSAHPTLDDQSKAVAAATTFISGNYSHNHGGGIMTNGSLTLGMTKDNYPMISLKCYKSLFVQNGNHQDKTQASINGSRFYFSIYRHKDDKSTTTTQKLPVWNGTEFTKGSGTNSLWKTVSNEASTDDIKAALVKFPIYKFTENGNYVYYIVENKGDDQTIDYDTTVYEVDIYIDDHGKTTIGTNETTQHSIKSYQVYKIAGSEKIRIGGSTKDFPFDDSKTDNAITIGSSNNNTAFTNTKHNYNITITKTDSENESKVLSDAKFKLYKLDDNNADASISTIDLTDLGEQTSKADGKISYSGLISGSKYYLVEEEAPEGYNKNGPWIIDMATSGLKIYQADCQFTTVNKKPQLIRNSNNPFVTGDGIKIKNSETYEITTTVTDEAIQYTMPNTGGMGTYIYYQVGFLLLALVNIVWIIKRRVA